MLEGQCGAWGSIIAAAVHVPLVQGKVVSGEPRLGGHQMGCRPACLLGLLGVASLIVGMRVGRSPSMSRRLI